MDKILEICPSCKKIPTHKDIKNNVIKVYCVEGPKQHLLIQVIDKGIVSYPDPLVAEILKKECTR